jgi:uncharacterized protein (TIGR00299 family) protein
MIDASRLTESQKDLAKRIFTRLGEAEAKVHGTTIRKVHFHEVGAVDSIADIVGTAIAIDRLAAERLVCSPVPTGTGSIEIAHGRVSIPAPATAELLRGIPLAASSVSAELTTPTGAAIVATLSDEFGVMPAMTIESIGYGAGERDLAEQANLLRLVVGQAAAESDQDQVEVLETNLDDVSGEIVAHCMLAVLEGGALDAYTTSIQMKKNRPGVKLTILCRASDRQQLEAIVFRETGTLGIRRWTAARHVVPRQVHQVQTPWGPIRGKIAHLPGGPATFSPEYESCRQIAARQGVAIRQVYEAARSAFQAGDGNQPAT